MSSTLAPHPTVHSLRLHFLMEKQQRLEIGQRIRELRENSAETNRSIADYVGVGERSVAAWLAGGGIAWENAKKVAELFGVDVDYVWRGESKSAAPDVMAALTPSTGTGDAELHRKLDEVLDGQRELLARVASIHDALELQSQARAPASRSKSAKSR